MEMWSAGRTMCSAKPKLNISSSVVTFKIQSADDPECRMEKAPEFTWCVVPKEAHKPPDVFLYKYE